MQSEYQQSSLTTYSSKKCSLMFKEYACLDDIGFARSNIRNYFLYAYGNQTRLHSAAIHKNKFVAVSHQATVSYLETELLLGKILW